MGGDRSSHRGESAAGGSLVAALSSWMALCWARSRAILALVALLSVGLGAYAASHLSIDMRHTALLDEGLDFWADYNAFAEIFPILDEALLVVVDAETPGRARMAASLLAERLEARPAQFSDVYVPGGDPFFERQALLYLDAEELEDLSDDLAAIQPLLAELSRDASLSNLASVLRDGIDMSREHPELPMDLGAAFDSVSRAAEAVLEGRPKPISWTEVILERRMPVDASRRLLVIDPVYDYSHILPGADVMRAVRDEAADLGLDEEHGVRVRITGNVAINTEEMRLISVQVLGMGAFSFALIGVILAFALRSAKLVFSLLIALAVGLIWTLAFAAFSVVSLNVCSITFAILFLGLAVDFGIHLSMRYAELVRGGMAPPEALDETARSIGGSCMLCAGTTAIGFYVFVPTEYRAVGELGLIAGTGMFIGLFVMVTLLPALFALGDPRRVGGEALGSRQIVRFLIHLAVARASGVRAATAVLSLLALLALTTIRFDHNVIALRDPSTESVMTFNELLSQSRTSPWTIDVLEPDLATAVEEARRIAALPVVERAVTLADYVPDEQEEKIEILADMGYFLPTPARGAAAAPRSVSEQVEALRALRESLDASWLLSGDIDRRESALRARSRLDRMLLRLETLEQHEEAEALASFERSLTGELGNDLERLWTAIEPDPIALEDLPGELRKRMVAPDGRARIQVLPTEDLSDTASYRRFVDAVQEIAPHATGSAVALLEWARAVQRAFRQALGTAVLAIGLLLFALWRRAGDVALVLVPLLLAATWTAATAGLLGLSFNFVNVLVIPLLMGFGVDSGIHLVHRHRSTLARHPDRPTTETELIGTSSAQAVFFSAMTTMVSFGSLMLVPHGGLRSLGQLLVIGVAYTLVANLVVLPSLLAWRRGAERVTASEAAV